LKIKMADRVKPNITPTVNQQGEITGRVYHYNAADNPEMLRRWKQYPLQDIVEEVPIQLDIETTTVCNLRCPMCWHSSPETSPVALHMPYEFYQHIIDEFADKGGTAVKLMYRGDPLVTRNIEHWIQYASERGVQPRFNTNGILLTPEKSKRLIETGLHQAIFSIDSHLPEEYERIRISAPGKKGDFQRVLANVRDLARIREEMCADYPIIEVSRVDLPETRESAGDFREFWLENGADYVSFVDPNDWTMGKMGQMLVSDQFCCEMPWQRMFVLADGVATACCGDTYQQFPLAQIMTAREISGLEEKLAGTIETQKPEEKVEVEVIRDKKLEKYAIGEIQTDGTVKAKSMRIRGITGNTREVPITSSIEEVWRGKLLEGMREVNRRGKAHLINACADCGYRETTIRKANLPHTIEPRRKTTQRTGTTSYLNGSKLK
jgi:pyruvate-formate lyase-activating enzyme